MPLVFILFMCYKSVADLVNANRKLKRRLKQGTDTQKYGNSLGDEDISFIMNSMSPISKNETLKRMTSTSGLLPLKKWLRKVANLRLREGRLFTDDEQPIPELDEKVIFFMLNVNKSFECPDKKKKEYVIAGTL